MSTLPASPGNELTSAETRWEYSWGQPVILRGREFHWLPGFLSKSWAVVFLYENIIAITHCIFDHCKLDLVMAGTLWLLASKKKA